MTPQRMDFGIFMAPFHPTGQNPTLDLQRDLELIQRLDQLGYDEAWIGEHHSAGWETIASPEVFIAAAGERTQHIRLGTGVVSVPYHHPFHVADRIILVDHLTRGRAMLGVGPGALPSDAHMLMLEPTRQREMMDEGLGIIIRLMTEDEPITYETDWFRMREAQLQLKPYQRPTMPMAVASTLSPAGMTSAGKHGVGVLSVASYAPEGLASLQRQWQYCEDAADKAGRAVPDRKDWRVVMPFHLADTKEEAERDIAEGAMRWNNEYYVGTLGAPMRQPVANGDEMIKQLHTFGAFVGTPDDAIAGIERLLDVSGGFGCFLGLAHDWATQEKTLHSFELMARYVMPKFQDTLTWTDRSQQWTAGNKQMLMEGARAGVFKAVVDGGATAELAKTIQQAASLIAPQTEGLAEFAEEQAEKAETAGS